MDDWRQELRDRHPHLLSGLGPYDLDCGSGWRPILEDLLTKLDALDVPDLGVAQIKEKFGGLRVYTDGGTEETWSLIRTAENRAWQTCETCGAPIETHNAATLCAACVAAERRRLLGRRRTP